MQVVCLFKFRLEGMGTCITSEEVLRIQSLKILTTEFCMAIAVSGLNSNRATNLYKQLVILG